MTRKSRFQLLSYLIDENLIYYKSLNKKKKIVAFSLFETRPINPIFSTLNQFLKKRVIQYYAIQMDRPGNKNNLFLLNFEEKKKELIIKTFNEIKQNIVRLDNSICFFKNSKLERKFLEPIINNSDSEVSLMKRNSSILLSNSNNSILISMYTLNLDYLENPESFINNFLRIINNFNRIGYLIFTFRIDTNDEIIFNPFFTEKCEKNDETFNTETSINTFFNYSILKKHDIKIKKIYYYLWRLGISDDYFYLNNFNRVFIKVDRNCYTKLVKFNEKVEKLLLKNQIDFIKLSKNLLFIEDKFLIIILTELNSKYIQKIIEKYHPKYYIYITILSKNKIQKLLEIPEIQTLRKLEVISSEDLLKFNFERFRNNS